MTGDGQHVAVNAPGGSLVLLRRRTGDYARQSLSESAAFQGEPIAMEDWPGARCNADFCSLVLRSGERSHRLLIGRSRERVPERALASACRRADIVIAGRWLPASCRPRWFRADRALLDRTGGLAIYLADRSVRTVAQGHAGHPWWDRAMALRHAAREKARAERLSTRPR